MSRVLVAVLAVMVAATVGVVSWRLTGERRDPVAGQEVRGGAPPIRAPLPPAPQGSPPADAVRVEVGDDLQALVRDHPPGTSFLLASGVHRLLSVEPRDGDRFVGEPGAVMSGAEMLDVEAFREDEGRWMLDGVDAEGFVHGTMLEGHEREAHPEDLYADGERLRHVERLADLDTDREWYLDYGTDRLHIAVDPGRWETLELAVTDFAFVGPGVRDVTIENLVVRHYAAPGQRGAINGRHTIDWTVRSVDASSNHAYGLGTGPGMLVEHSRFTDNGQAGVGGPGARHSESPVGPGEARPIRVLSNEIADNRQLGFYWRWEGGGTKFTLTSGMVFANNHVHGNDGPGLWWDIDNEDAVGCANLVQDNVIGIFPEIGQGARVFWNEVRDNLRAGEEDASTGIFVSNTSDVEIAHNVVSGQPLGILARDADEDETGDHGPRRTTGLWVHDNVVAHDDHSGMRIETELTDGRDTVRFERNHWLVPDPAGPFWVLGDDDDPIDWTAWREAGMDRQGQVSALAPDHRPVLPPGVPAFTPTHYGPVAAGEDRPVHPPAASCADELP